MQTEVRDLKALLSGHNPISPITLWARYKFASAADVSPQSRLRLAYINSFTYYCKYFMEVTNQMFNTVQIFSFSQLWEKGTPKNMTLGINVWTFSTFPEIFGIIFVIALVHPCVGLRTSHSKHHSGIMHGHNCHIFLFFKLSNSIGPSLSIE